MVILPRFTLFGGVSYPNAHRVIAETQIAKHITVTLRCNRKRTKWWLTASSGEFRTSDGLATTSKTKAETWEKAVRAGTVAIASASIDPLEEKQ